MAHFKAFLGSHQDLGPKTAVPVLGTRPRPRSELKTLDTLGRKEGKDGGKTDERASAAATANIEATDRMSSRASTIDTEYIS